MATLKAISPHLLYLLQGLWSPSQLPNAQDQLRPGPFGDILRKSYP